MNANKFFNKYKTVDDVISATINAKAIEFDKTPASGYRKALMENELGKQGYSCAEITKRINEGHNGTVYLAVKNNDKMFTNDDGDLIMPGPMIFPAFFSQYELVIIDSPKISKYKVINLNDLNGVN